MMQEGVSCDRSTYTSWISTCASATMWLRAITLYKSTMLNTVQPDSVWQPIISASTDQWRQALEFISRLGRLQSTPLWRQYLPSAASKVRWRALVLALMRFQEANGEPDLKLSGVLCESTTRAGWRKVMALVHQFGLQQISMDAFLYSSAMSSCRSSQSGKWSLVRALLDRSTRCSQCDTVVWNSFLASRGVLWPTALSTLSDMGSAGYKADTISYNCIVAACREQWQLVVASYEHMASLSLELDVAFSSAIDCCKHSLQLQVGRRILDGAKQISCIMRFWAMAQMSILTDLSSCFADVLRQVATRMLTCAEVSKLWWATASLGLHHSEMLRHLETHSTRLLSRFTLEELVAVAMGACTTAADAQFLRALQFEVTSRAEALERQEETAPQVILQQLVGILWALNFAVPVRHRVFVCFRQLFRRLASLLDVVSLSEDSGARTIHSTLDRHLTSPAVVLTLSDCLVTAKPAGWEVYGDTKLQMLPYIQTLLGELPIHQDPEHAFGFLHRLDIPSSGLILSASTYTALYDLQLQLVSGRLLRDYVVLCHGHVPKHLSEIQVRLQLNDVATAGAQGKAARTLVHVVARTSNTEGMAFSLTLVRILTGRLHQIRSHFAFVGHPTASDGKYTTASTFGADLGICPRNFLHRYHLSFEDRRGCTHRVFMHLPADLCNCLKSLTALDEATSQQLEKWVLGQEQFWEEFVPDG